MSRLFDQIQEAVAADRFVIAWHADERCEERGVAPWQLAASLPEARIIRERRHTKPNASVVLRHMLPDGTDVEAVWAWLSRSRRAKLVTVYFRE